MKNRKILVAGGDSFTEHTRVSYCDPSLATDFPRWSAKLAEKLDMECVNLGKEACDNHYISTSVFEYLIENPKKEIGLVCCLWGVYTRTSLYNMPDWPANVVQGLFTGRVKEYNDLADARNAELHKEEAWFESDKWIAWHKSSDKFLDLLYYYTKNTNTKAETIVENIIKNTIKIFHDLECMLNLRNIPYHYFQGVFPFYYRHQLDSNRGLEKIYAPPDEQLLFYFLKYEKYFNKEKFIEWPGLPITASVPPWGDDPVKYCISEEDLHPNETAHQTMANYLYKKTEELYPYLLQEGK